jgi:hypothetical protein
LQRLIIDDLSGKSGRLYIWIVISLTPGLFVRNFLIEPISFFKVTAIKSYKPNPDKPEKCLK